MKVEQVIKSQNITTLELRTTVTLFHTHNWLFEKHRLFFETFGLTNQQYYVLRILLGQFPKPVGVKFIREQSLDKLSDTSRIIERLVKLNLVIRKDSATDRRVVDIILSDAGHKLMLEIEDKLIETQEYLNKLTADEMQQLCKLLDKLRG
jgi:DNA-binding MarR family transcriptional regulator